MPGVGTPAKVSADTVEVLCQWDPKAKVSSHVVEVLSALGSYVTWTPYTGTTLPLGDATYSDECNTVTPDAKWVRRNAAGVITGDGTQYSVALNSTRDAVTEAFTDPTGDIDLMVHLKGITDGQGMIGLYALDSGHNGYGISRYSDGNVYGWLVSNYAYANTLPNLGAGCTLGDHWLDLSRSGGSWRGRWSNDGSTWTAWSSQFGDSRTVTEIGIAHIYNNTTQTVQIERVNYGVGSFDMTGFAGGALVSHRVVEVLTSVEDLPPTKVGQDVVEVLMAGDGFVKPSPGVFAYGHIG